MDKKGHDSFITISTFSNILLIGINSKNKELIHMESQYLDISKKVRIVFNYRICKSTFCNLGLSGAFFPSHGVLAMITILHI
jgi:hypothetical protein